MHELINHIIYNMNSIKRSLIEDDRCQGDPDYYKDHIVGRVVETFYPVEQDFAYTTYMPLNDDSDSFYGAKML